MERFYLVVYSAEKRNTPVKSHCFATFARVTRSGVDVDGDEPQVELHHINWFSVRGHRSGSTFGLIEADGRPTRPEPGENRTTRDALELVLHGGRRVTRWGPYEINRELFVRALRQIDFLEGRIPGRPVLYKAFDLGYREGAEIVALNCIHAVSDIVREPTPLRTWTTYGDAAARRVVRHLLPWIRRGTSEPSDIWPRIWTAIWDGAPARPADTIVQAQIPAPSEHVARASDDDTTGSSLTMNRSNIQDGG